MSNLPVTLILESIVALDCSIISKSSNVAQPFSTKNLLRQTPSSMPLRNSQPKAQQMKVETARS